MGQPLRSALHDRGDQCEQIFDECRMISAPVKDKIAYMDAIYFSAGPGLYRSFSVTVTLSDY